MTHRRALLPLTALVVTGFALAACGSETVDVQGTTSSGIPYPTAGNQAVVRLTTGGGFVPQGYDFSTPPELVIEGDGTVFRPGAQIEIYPEPLLPAVTRAALDQEGIQIVLQAAEKAGLLAPAPSYEAAGQAAQVADAPTTILEIQANGETYRHEAYALGFEQAARSPLRPARR